MAMNGIGAPGGSRPVALSRSADEAALTEQRALVPVYEASRSDSHGPYTRRPSAAFLAQLIATESDEPQTRQLRRAAPDMAARAYAAALELNSRKN